MPKYEVIVTRTKTEVASVTVSAKSEEEAERTVTAKMQPVLGDRPNADELEKAALKYFDDNLADSADVTVEFEYEVSEG